MRSKNKRVLFGVVLLIVFASAVITAVGDTYLFAQSADTSLIERRRAQLEADLKNLENLIAQQQSLLQEKRGERVTLERDLEILDGEIKKARLAIQAQRLLIAELEDEIVDKEVEIRSLEEKMNRERESLASIIRRTDELDQLSLVEILLSEGSLSKVFEEYDDFSVVKAALQESYKELEALRASTEAARDDLQEQRATEEELRQLRLLQQNKLEAQEDEKVRILRATQGEESRYQELIAANERTAAQIRSELFELRGSAAINLGDAIEFATFASSKTGVRPALILGVLKQETRMGEFLGSGSWTVDMHPTRDRPLFQVITRTLGMDPNRMPVSAKPSYGWGGAMGPAQFIPSTWACYGGYINVNTGGCSNRPQNMSWDEFWAGPWAYDKDKDRLRIIRGKQSPSNPWDNQDAFLASGVLMRDNGADKGTYADERLAALRYFAGWGNATNPAYAFYGDSVMEHAAYYQKQIDALKSLE